MIQTLVSAFALALAVSAHAADWNADLDLLRVQLPKTHPNAFHAVSRETFNAHIDALKSEAMSLPPEVVVARIARIVASIGDGHTRLTLPIDPNAGFFLGHTPTPMPSDAALRFHHLPLRLYLYADGLFVTDAENAALRGRRVLRLGAMSADEAIAAMLPFVAADNDSGRKLGVVEMLVIPEMLHAAGISVGTSGTTISVDGATETLATVPFGAETRWLTKPDPRKFHFTSRDGIIHAVINEIGGEKEETFPRFVARLMAFVCTHPVDALIIDLRQNPGGNGAFNKSLVHALIREPKFHEPGHLFVLIGRRTFSAATFLLTALEQNTNAIFAGEPSGGKPNGWGDSRKILLPSSGLTVRSSTLYWQPSDPRDTRDAIGAEIDAPPTSTHPDAAMERVTDVVRRAGKTATLDGTWRGNFNADWERVPVEIVDDRLRMLKSASEPLAGTRRVRTTVKDGDDVLSVDLRVGDGVAFGTITTPQGLVFPMMLQRN